MLGSGRPFFGIPPQGVDAWLLRAREELARSQEWRALDQHVYDLVRCRMAQDNIPYFSDLSEAEQRAYVEQVLAGVLTQRGSLLKEFLEKTRRVVETQAKLQLERDEARADRRARPNASLGLEATARAEAAAQVDVLVNTLTRLVQHPSSTMLDALVAGSAHSSASQNPHGRVVGGKLGPAGVSDGGGGASFGRAFLPTVSGAPVSDSPARPRGAAIAGGGVCTELWALVNGFVPAGVRKQLWRAALNAAETETQGLGARAGGDFGVRLGRKARSGDGEAGGSGSLLADVNLSLLSTFRRVVLDAEQVALQPAQLSQLARTHVLTLAKTLLSVYFSRVWPRYSAQQPSPRQRMTAEFERGAQAPGVDTSSSPDASAGSGRGLGGNGGAVDARSVRVIDPTHPQHAFAYYMVTPFLYVFSHRGADKGLAAGEADAKAAPLSPASGQDSQLERREKKSDSGPVGSGWDVGAVDWLRLFEQFHALLRSRVCRLLDTGSDAVGSGVAGAPAEMAGGLGVRPGTKLRAWRDQRLLEVVLAELASMGPAADAAQLVHELRALFASDRQGGPGQDAPGPAEEYMALWLGQALDALFVGRLPLDTVVGLWDALVLSHFELLGPVLTLMPLLHHRVGNLLPFLRELVERGPRRAAASLQPLRQSTELPAIWGRGAEEPEDHVAFEWEDAKTAVQGRSATNEEEEEEEEEEKDEEAESSVPPVQLQLPLLDVRFEVVQFLLEQHAMPAFRRRHALVL